VLAWPERNKLLVQQTNQVQEANHEIGVLQCVFANVCSMARIAPPLVDNGDALLTPPRCRSLHALQRADLIHARVQHQCGKAERVLMEQTRHLTHPTHTHTLHSSALSYRRCAYNTLVLNCKYTVVSCSPNSDNAVWVRERVRLGLALDRQASYQHYSAPYKGDN
jgi:hypothetical protein